MHGPETVSIFIANLLAIFNDILRNILTILYAKTYGTLFIADSAVTSPVEALGQARVGGP